MKKNYILTLLLTLSISGLSFGQGAEPFTNSAATSSYADGSFVGNAGVTWSYVQSRDANNDKNNSGISLPAIMLRNSSSDSKITSSTISGGIGDFSVKLYKGFTGGGNRQVELFINGVSKGSSEAFDDYDEHIFTVSGINMIGDVIIELKNKTSKQVIVDDITWTDPSSDPSITIGSAVSSLDYFEGNGPSEEKTFTVGGINLSGNVNVTAPTNFEVSLTSGGTFTDSVVLTQTAGTVASTPVYVRLKASLGVNTYSGDVTITSTGVNNQTLALSGEITAADPQITVTAFLDDFNYAVSEGGPSPEDSFSVEGLFLTTDVVATAPTNYEISLATDTGFGSSVNITPSSGTVISTTIYVRLKDGLSAGNYTGDITISSTGITDETITVNGSVYGAPTNSMVITGVYDGSLSGGTPKGVEIYVLKDIADLTLFGVSSVSNGGGSTAGNVEFSFPAGSATAGTFIYVATEATNFNVFFGISPTHTSGSMGINGDDAIELYENGQIIDVYGDVDNDFSNEAYDYLDGWAYRKPNTGPEGTTFNSANWNYSGVDGLEGGTNNATAKTPFPIGTYANTSLSVNRNSIEGFAIYPNPVSEGILNISSASSSIKNLTIFNLLGKKVLSSSFSGIKKDIDVSSINAGMYILKVTEKGKTATKKLVIR
jgi:hypothetical protein